MRLRCRRVRIRVVLEGFREETRTTTPGHNQHMVLARHRLLQPKPVPKRCVQRRRLVTSSRDDERTGRAFQGEPCTSFNRALLHSARLLVHCRLRRHPRSLEDSTEWVFLHDALHVHPHVFLQRFARHTLRDKPITAMRRKPHLIHHSLRLDILLRQFRTQCDDFHRPGGAIPSQAPIHMPWNLRSGRESGRHTGCIRILVRSSGTTRRRTGAWLFSRNRVEEHVSRSVFDQCSGLLHDVSRAGNQRKIAGRALGREQQRFLLWCLPGGSREARIACALKGEMLETPALSCCSDDSHALITKL